MRLLEISRVKESSAGSDGTLGMKDLSFTLVQKSLILSSLFFSDNNVKNNTMLLYKSMHFCGIPGKLIKNDVILEWIKVFSDF